MWGILRMNASGKSSFKTGSIRLYTKGGIFGATLIAAVLVVLFLAVCDLLNNKPEIDLEKTMDAEIAYANAAQLTVEVYYPESWGRSPAP
jgi:hypothetical protein